MYVARTEIEVDKRLRELYAEDSDWNLVLRNLTTLQLKSNRKSATSKMGSPACPTRSHSEACFQN